MKVRLLARNHVRLHIAEGGSRRVPDAVVEGLDDAVLEVLGPTLQEVQRWVATNPAADHSVAHLAARMGLSERHFARLFRQEVGVTPAAWVEDIRVAAARGLLEAGDAAPKQVASLCGFADTDTLRRAFQRQVGITPAEYRKRFAHAIV